MRLTCCLVVVVCLSEAAAEVHIVGGTRYPPYSLVRLRAAGLGDKDAPLWRVTPPVNRATSTDRAVLEFTAPPGKYRVELAALRLVGDRLEISEAHADIEIDPAGQERQPEKPKPERVDPTKALYRVRFGNAGCTATVIGPRRHDGLWDVLTAAHCVSGPGAKGILFLSETNQTGLTVVAYNRQADMAWCLTHAPLDNVYCALVAQRNPEPGTKIWHAGFGVDKPGNREEGVITHSENLDGQLQMLLSVSSGDSGGGIFREDTGELVSVVCCTNSLGRRASVWGCSAEVANRYRPGANKGVLWEPIPLPLR